MSTVYYQTPQRATNYENVHMRKQLTNRTETIDQNVINAFYDALHCPLLMRCERLARLFDTLAAHELSDIYCILVQSIFGTNGQVGWGLRTIVADDANPHVRDTHQALLEFLSPLGPVFRVIYKLLTVNDLFYTYPLDQLPDSVRNFANTQSHDAEFYHALSSFDYLNRATLRLNAFDFYMFNFAWHLVAPAHQRVGDVQWFVWNTTYHALAAAYLVHFLPADVNTVVLPLVVAKYPGKNPRDDLSARQTASTLHRSLFRSEVYRQMSADEVDTYDTSHLRNDTWRSETIARVFVDFWLSSDSFTRAQSFYAGMPVTNNLPSIECLRICRGLIKETHAFASQAASDITAMGGLRKTITAMVQGKIYPFMRHLIHTWPMDSSFRLVLELWLCYLQPWRYASAHGDADDHERALTHEHVKFIANNFICYTVILQQVLARFLRVDLSCPSNALMLFRVTKVFARRDLVNILRDIERGLDTKNYSPKHHMWTKSQLPPLSPTSSWSTNNRQQIKDEPRAITPTDSTRSYQNVRQQIYQLEGLDFAYRAIFNVEPAREVMQLITYSEQCRVSLESELRQLDATQAEKRGVFAYVSAWFHVDDVDHLNVNDKKRVPFFLQNAKKYLCTMFDLNETDVTLATDVTDSANDANVQNLSFNLTDTSMDTSLNNNEWIKRLKTLKYEGDPDLAPIRSDEVDFLVRAFHAISQRVNEQYQRQITNLYHAPTFSGRVFRHVAQPPRLVYKWHAQAHGQVARRVQEMLPPRISLRALAGQRFLARCVLLALVGWFFNFKFITIVACACFVWFACVVARCAWDAVRDNL